MAIAVAVKQTAAPDAPDDGAHFLRAYRAQLMKELAEVDRRLQSGTTVDR